MADNSQSESSSSTTDTSKRPGYGGLLVSAYDTTETIVLYCLQIITNKHEKPTYKFKYDTRLISPYVSTK